MKIYQILLGALPGALVGLFWAWSFVFTSLLPWLGVPLGWTNIVGLLLYLCFFAEVGAGIGAILGVILVGLAAMLIGQASHRDLRQFLNNIWRNVRRATARLVRRNK